MTGRKLDGRIRLEMNGTAWRKAQQTPLYLTMLNRGESWLAMAADQSGGMRGGDAQSTSLELRGGADLDWKPPASAIFHASSQEAELCEVETRISLDSGSRLSWTPKPAIPCSGARVRQSSELRIESGSEFLYWDLWCNGRTAHGEEWRFLEIENGLSLYRDGELRFRERWRLRGDDASAIHGPSGLRGARIWGLCLAQGPRSLAGLDALVAGLKKSGITAESGVLDTGLRIARILSPVSEDILTFAS